MGLLPLLAALAVVVGEGTELRTYSAGQDFLWVARAEAGDLLVADPALVRHPLLLAELRRFEEAIHLE